MAMKIGMLWFHKPANTDALNEAVEYYAQKYGERPNTVFVNPKDVGTISEIAGLQVRQSRSILPFHFWIGVDAEG